MPSLLRSRRRWLVLILVGLALFPAWYFTAYPRGVLMAYLDHARGHHEVKTFGLPAPWEPEYARLLRQKYGVELHPVAGCVVSPELVWYVEGYDEVSERLLIEKYGRDIFTECDTAVRQKWQAKHPQGW